MTVTKKDGSTKQENVGKVVWTGNGVVLTTIARARGYIEFGTKILRSGECGDCYEERKMGY